LFLVISINEQIRQYKDLHWKHSIRHNPKRPPTILPNDLPSRKHKVLPYPLNPNPISIPIDQEKRSKGYAFCDFPSRELAEAAIRNLNGCILKKREVRVSYTGSSEPEKWPEENNKYISKVKSELINNIKSQEGISP
jgi:RNA recognition motif-containing protein